MKTFKDLVFKKHKVCKGIQASLEIKPNVFISVVAGEGMYSSGKSGVRGAVNKVEDVSSFEVAIIDENLPLIVGTQTAVTGDGTLQFDIRYQVI